MKVLIVQTRFPPALGGLEKHGHQLVKYLALDGYDVTVYTTSSLSNEDVYSFSLRPPFILKPKKKTHLPHKEVFLNAVVQRYSLKWRYWSLNWIPGMFRELKRATADFDLVHAHGYHHTAALVSCYYAKKFHTPFLLTGHDLIISRDLPADAQNIYKLYERTLGGYMLKNSTGLVALTDDQVEQYVERGADVRKISVIPNGIELEKFKKQDLHQDLLTQYGIAEDDKILLFVGRLIERKGIQDIISILPQLLGPFPETKLVIAGEDYGYKNQLKALAARHRLEANVIFTGPVSDQQVAQLYRRASIFVLPSQMEGFGIVLLEAMASGTLCVAYSIPSVRRVIHDGTNGVLVKGKSELLANVLYYLSHPEEKAEIEKNALESVNAYDIRQTVKATEQVYERCVR
ncbi:MAG: glycosyltransferase family 4 protein [Halobacteriota archaeon]